MLPVIAIGAVFAALAYTPSTQAHGQLEWVKVNGGQPWPAWNLDDHYKAKYKKQDPQYGEQPQQKYTLKTDATDLGPTDIYNNAIGTGGFNDAFDFDSISPAGVINVKAGDEITVKWDNHWPWPGHPGPAQEHMAKCVDDNCSADSFLGLKWFSIAQHNYNPDTGKWPTEAIPESREFSFKLPTDLPTGHYLLRHEFYSLHARGSDTKCIPQHYPTSMHVYYENSAGGNLPGDQFMGTLPGMFSHADYEWNYYIYDYPPQHEKFEMPGVPVYSGGYTTGVVNGKTAAARADPNYKSSAPAPAPAPDAGSSSSSLAVNNHIATTSEVAAPSSTSVGAPGTPASTSVATTPSKGKDTCRIRTKRGIKRVRRRSGTF